MQHDGLKVIILVCDIQKLITTDTQNTFACRLGNVENIDERKRRKLIKRMRNVDVGEHAHTHKHTHIILNAKWERETRK